MNWYKHAQEQTDIEKVARQLINSTWRKYKKDFEDGNKYNGMQIRILIENDPDLYRICMQYGEDAYWKIIEQVEEELIALEDSEKFQPRREQLSGSDPLKHLRDAIRGKSWDQAKNQLVIMGLSGGPGGNAFWNGSEILEDDRAEAIFIKLYQVSFKGGYLNLNMLLSQSSFRDENGNRVLKRLSEIRPVERHKSLEMNHSDFVEEQLCLHLFGGKPPTPSIRVFRGVQRADATIRPGDYVTPSRSYASTYGNGNYAAVIRETLPTDDLIIGTTAWGYDEVELIYYPRDTQIPNDPEVPVTFREFWTSVNPGNDQD